MLDEVQVTEAAVAVPESSVSKPRVPLDPAVVLFQLARAPMPAVVAGASCWLVCPADSVKLMLMLAADSERLASREQVGMSMVCFMDTFFQLEDCLLTGCLTGFPDSAWIGEPGLVIQGFSYGC